MESLILARKYTEQSTQGVYIVMDDMVELFRCKCLELPWLTNQKNISCIPGATVYDVEKRPTIKHPNGFLIKNVPNRTGIMIHAGNFTTDIEGCQMPGFAFLDIDSNGTIDVAHSVQALKMLNYFLPEKFKLYIL